MDSHRKEFDRSLHLYKTRISYSQIGIEVSFCPFPNELQYIYS